METFYAPNAQGHNHIPFGELSPGVTNLIELELRDIDEVTGEFSVQRDMTGWTSPRVRLSSTRLVDGDYAMFLEIAAEFDSDPTTGKIRWRVTSDDIAGSLITDERRFSVTVDAINPEGDRVPLFTGSTHLGRGSK